MTIDKSIRRILVSLVLAGTGASILGLSVERARAASASAEVAATVLQGTTVAAVSVLDVAPTISAPSVGSSRDIGVVNGAGAASSASRTSSTSARSAGAPLIGSTAAAGGPAVISISGQPNQAISISLPNESIVIANGAQVAVTGFTHDAGLTPTIDATGNGTFNVTATAAAEVNADAGGESGGTGATSNNGQGAATSAGQVPFEKLLVATASPRFDVVISYN